MNITIDLNSEQYNNLMTLLRESQERSRDSILTCSLEANQVDELIEVCQ